MTPGEPIDTTPTRKPLPVIPQDRYASLPTGELVLFAVQHLHADGMPATLEEIVSLCFKLFPHRFSLKNYFYWPDSAHVAQALKYAREKGCLKDSPPDGYILRPAGRKLARQAAKAMGIPFPMPPKAERLAADDGQRMVEKPTTEEKPQTVKAKKSKPAPVNNKKKQKRKAKPKQKPKKTKSSGVRRLAAEVTRAISPTPKKKTAPGKKTVTQPKAQPKKTVSKPAPKVQAKKPASKPASKKNAPARKAVKKARAVTRLPLTAPAAPKKEAQKPVVKKTPAVKIVQPKPVAEIIPVVSKEEKAKADKVIKLVERSDAYRLYKKLGAKARISEFDFRDMLFATMESSAETLRRNVDLFKRYADIHNRADLITFLDFAEGSFAPLLKIQAKTPARKK